MRAVDTDRKAWREFFANRSERPLPPLEKHARYAELPSSLARSLAIFQLGESGGGTIIDQARSSRLPQIDAYYAESMALFVREEHRRGRRTLCIIHGKGKHSEGGIGVLRGAAVEALTKGGAAPLVECLASAPERFGGSGALLVRLSSK